MEEIKGNKPWHISSVVLLSSSVSFFPFSRCPVAPQRALPGSARHSRSRLPSTVAAGKSRGVPEEAALREPAVTLTRAPPLVPFKNSHSPNRKKYTPGEGRPKRRETSCGFWFPSYQKGAIYPCPTRRGGTAVPSRPVPSRGCRRCPPVPALRGNSTAGPAVGPGRAAAAGAWVFLLYWRNCLRGWEDVSGRSLFLCVWCSLLWVWRAGPGCCSSRRPVLFILEICQPEGKKNADLGSLVFLLFPFILFKEKAGELLLSRRADCMA